MKQPRDKDAPAGDDAGNAHARHSRSDIRPFLDATELLSRIWHQNLPLMRERVDTLRRAGAQAVAAPLDEPTRTLATDLAHKLAGSLGMFGYPRGTEIARDIETMLETEGAVDGQHLHELTEALHASLPL